MGNLSKIRRDRMIAFLDRIREEHKDDDETLIAINEIEHELNSKKYGLVWEEHEEEVDVMLRKNVPVFTEVKEREINAASDENYNFLLEGDNLHSLKLLEKTHKGKIDVIYIDPPYNTGNRDFIYNDEFVGVEDVFFNSKWLSFMEKRLNIARSLMSKKGIIFISIDDNEQAALKLLCDGVFGSNNFVANLTRVTKKSGKDHADGIAKNNDYVLVYTKDKSNTEFKGILAEENEYPLKDEYYEKRGGYKLNQTLDYDSLWYNTKMDFPIEICGETFYAGGTEDGYKNRHMGDHKPKDWVWRWSIDKLKFGLKNGFVVIKEGKNRKRIYTKTYANATISNSKPYKIEYKTRETKLSSIALVDNAFSNDNAKKEISRIGLDEFGFPKPQSLIKQLINITKNQKIILDFFAGSGTTAQAVLELNKEDGGNRKFILCTNNENNICEDITYQRIKTVITGKRQDGSEYSEGIPANLKYYRTDFISKEEGYLSDVLQNHVNELIELKYGVKLDNQHFVILKSDEDADDLEKNWDKYADIKKIFISREVLLTGKQEELFSRVDTYIVPDCFYGEELREVGELW